MAAAQIKLEVVTPTRAVLSVEVDEVVLPGSLGQMGILPGHLPLLTGLDVGAMILRDNGTERRFFIDKGFAEILDDKISVLTQGCEGVSDIDIEHARAEFKEAEQEIGRLEKLTNVEEVEDTEELLKRYRESLERARTRLLVAGEGDASDA
ncbi:ATP synthase F1 subunit epsilon [Bradymonas sediminis]|uniref:ATP synthase epsilon chain n=1 Tax=Bradymonas sediminis TaxID=1548548 RepID=A0A2Z4FLQ1_9DELT|nr:ATP synthase F1 subunit epsilon [Bradymonas sediminis]AWV89862.1 ATP synthase F1 subunit epsilon [Bradymonas sediminis]TDP76387.1 ATP synthase F1 subcomplex epsilon subunit [Bradymonas sediminis]